jgi:hypothetical protein
MSSLTRKHSLAMSVLAAVRGRKANAGDEENPEGLENEDETDADEQEISPDANASDDEPDAENDDNEPDAEGDEIDPDADDEKPSKEASSRIRKAEQSRIKTILTHPKAQANHGLAMELAFGKTFYSANAASALLNSSAGGGSRLADRMSGNKPRLGSGGAPSQPTERQSIVAGVHKTIQAMHGRKPTGA